MDYGPAPESTGPAEAVAGSARTRLRAVHRRRAAARRRRRRRDLRDGQPRPLAIDDGAPCAQCGREPRSTRRSPRRAPPRAGLARLSAGTGAPATSTPSPARCRSARASSPSSRRWTTASRSARPATSTCRWWHATSTTTPAGRSCSNASSPDYGCRWASPAQVIPWNFPLLMLAWKIAPALACGNTVVLKPAEYTPLSAMAFAEICRDVRTAAGRGQPGHRRRPHRRDLLVRHPDVDKVAFTGSTGVGRLIRQATAGSGKKLSLELGGKSPFIVFDDADLDGAVEGVVDAIWFNQGEVCCAGSRLLVHEGVARHAWSTTSSGRAWRTLRVGNPADKAIDIGAIVAPVQLERIEVAGGAGGRGGAPTLLAALLDYMANCPAGRLVLPADPVHRGGTRPPPSPRRRSSARCWWR